MQLYTPEGFDPSRYLPPSLQHRVDYVRYFVHLLYEQRVVNLQHKSGFVPLKAKYVSKMFPDTDTYREVKQSLLDAGIVETDGFYIEGRKCYGFRLGEDWRDKTHHKVPVTNKFLIGKIAKAKAESERAISRFPHRFLFEHLKRLEIDGEAARRSLKGRKRGLYGAAIGKVEDKDWFFTICPYGRCHNNLSNFPKAIRPFLSVGGKRLVNLDIANSQPLLLAVVLINYFNNDQFLESINNLFVDCSSVLMINSVFQYCSNNPSFFSSSTTHNTPTTTSPPYDPVFGYKKEMEEGRELLSGTGLHLRDALPDDGKKYIKLVEEGKFYEHLMEKGQIEQSKRKKFKRKVFKKLFFGKTKDSKEAKLFQSEFPSVYDVICQIKETDYRRLAHLLQRYESCLIIDRAVERIRENHPEVWIGTIHDSIVTTPENEGMVLGVMKTVFKEVGLSPTINVERY